jgi:hypothetical protein
MKGYVISAALALLLLGCSGGSDSTETTEPTKKPEVVANDEPTEVVRTSTSDDPLDVDRDSLKVGDVSLWMDMSFDYAKEQMGTPIEEWTIAHKARGFAWMVGGVRVVGNFEDAGALGWFASGKGTVIENHFGELTAHILGEDLIESIAADRELAKETIDGEGITIHDWVGYCGPEGSYRLTFGTSVPWDEGTEDAVLKSIGLAYDMRLFDE